MRLIVFVMGWNFNLNFWYIIDMNLSFHLLPVVTSCDLGPQSYGPLKRRRKLVIFIHWNSISLGARRPFPWRIHFLMPTVSLGARRPFPWGARQPLTWRIHFLLTGISLGGPHECPQIKAEIMLYRIENMPNLQY